MYEAQLAKALAAQARELQARAADALAAERLQRIRAIDEARSPAPARTPRRAKAAVRKACEGATAPEPSARRRSAGACLRGRADSCADSCAD